MDNVRAVLLYASESKAATQRTVDKNQVFINKCLRMILNIHWPDTIMDKELWKKKSEQPDVESTLKKKMELDRTYTKTK